MENNKQAKDNFKMPGMRGPRSRQQVEKPKNGKKTMIRLCKYFSSEKLMLLGLISAVIIVVVCSVIAPSLQSNAIDTIASKRFEQLPFILLIMIIVYLINSICNFFQSLISAKLSQRIVKKMRNDLFEKIVELPIQYIDNHSHGDIMSRMTNDVENISNTISQSLSSLVSGVLTIIGTVLIMIWYCWQLALLSCFTVILTILATKYLSGAMRKFYKKRQVILGNLNGTVEEMVTGYKTVVAYNHQNEVKKTFNETSDELTKTGIIAEILGGSMGPVMNVINNIGFVIIAAFGGFFAINNMISIGVISAFIVYAKQFGRPIDEIAQIYGQIQTAIASAERVFDIIDVKSEDKSGSNNMDSLQGIISFEHVNFSYIKGKTVLSDFNLEVPAGHKVALVGATGSGKTTVVNLLMRFYDIDSGSIKIDGVNIKDIDCENLRKNTAIVLQDTVLFSDTIKNNLKYSNENADDEEKGYIYIADGDFTITSDGDGMDASNIVQIEDGTFDITAGGGAANSLKTHESDVPGGPGGGMPQNGEKPDGENMPQHTTTDESGTSTKGIKAGGGMYLNGGTYQIDSADDSIHSNANITIADGTYTLATGDDGVHADDALIVNGGTITVTESYEGLEGLTVTINDGTIDITASDDGINTAGEKMELNGGYIHILAGGDGVDSNGDLTINGGEIYIDGPSDNGNSAIDYGDRSSAYVNGGTLVAIGSSGMAEVMSDSSKQKVLMVKLGEQMEAGNVVLTDSEGNVIVSYTALKTYDCVIISTAEVESGATYTLTTSGTTTEVTAE